MNRTIYQLIGAIAFSILPHVTLHAQNAEALRDSLKQATEALAYRPDSVDLRLKKAAWNMLLEQWDYAKSEYDIILQYYPDNVAGLYYRGYANQKLGRYNFARLDYENLLKVVPGHFSGLLGLALLNQQDKHYTDAMNQINTLVTLYPDSAVAYAARAGIERERGLMELAEYDYTEALNHHPNQQDYLLNRADVRIKLGQFEKAKEDVERLVQLGVPRPGLLEWYRRQTKK